MDNVSDDIMTLTHEARRGKDTVTLPGRVAVLPLTDAPGLSRSSEYSSSDTAYFTPSPPIL